MDSKNAIETTLISTSKADFETGAQELPRVFVEWQMSSRRGTYARVAKGERPTRFSAHLPVVVTLKQSGEFPVHSASKGTGFTPRDEYIDEYITLIDDCLVCCQG